MHFSALALLPLALAVSQVRADLGSEASSVLSGLGLGNDASDIPSATGALSSAAAALTSNPSALSSLVNRYSTDLSGLGDAASSLLGSSLGGELASVTGDIGSYISSDVGASPTGSSSNSGSSNDDTTSGAGGAKATMIKAMVPLAAVAGGMLVFA